MSFKDAFADRIEHLQSEKLEAQKKLFESDKEESDILRERIEYLNKQISTLEKHL